MVASNRSPPISRRDDARPRQNGISHLLTECHLACSADTAGNGLPAPCRRETRTWRFAKGQLGRLVPVVDSLHPSHLLLAGPRAPPAPLRQEGYVPRGIFRLGRGRPGERFDEGTFPEPAGGPCVTSMTLPAPRCCTLPYFSLQVPTQARGLLLHAPEALR